MHPPGLIGVQSLQGVLQTFGQQLQESQKQAKRQSIAKAAFFLPMLVIDTAAIILSGPAEDGGIWMQSSVSPYRKARVLSNKMASVPNKTEITREQLVKDAARITQSREITTPHDEEPGALRWSLNALRRSMGSVKYPASRKRTKSRAKKSDEAVAQKPGASNDKDSAISGYDGVIPSIIVDSEFCGFLDHCVEAVESNESSAEGDNRGTHDIAQEEQPPNQQDQSIQASQAKGQDFQLTLCSSPGMDLLRHYVHSRCHNRDKKLFPSCDAAPTEKEVLTMLGWEPKERCEPNSQIQADDHQWQTRETEDDLRKVASKAAKSWQKQCHKYVGKQTRSVIRKPSKITMASRDQQTQPAPDFTLGQQEAQGKDTRDQGLTAKRRLRLTVKAIFRRHRGERLP
ncbi:hypothetical protein BD289DRAFT_440988 [Coniella lustricola]|uniref:Uncharacterized protein n=1 Tax=Coniella lustricola TaxID=2025994 RepID=A0A2T2ZZZ3_9PEZI|nr:hypothetical protein BD289DRAFT_440988 [Coniella lustricola]